MPTLGNYFIDGTSLSNASAVFDTAALTTKAPDGFYSDGAIVREQVGGFLTFQTVCPSCTFPCGQAINAGGGSGVFELTFGTGNSVGCTIIYFWPQSVPDGIRVLYDNNTFNQLTSPQFGYLASNNANNYTFIGATGSDCNPPIGQTLDAGGYSGLDERQWNGSSFDLVGTSGTVTGTSGDVVLTAGSPGYSTLYVPKNVATPEDFTVQITGVCGTQWNVEINCPVLLTGVPTSQLNGGCDDEKPNTYYNVPNRNGTAGEPAVREFFVTDAYGNNRAAQGSYTIDPPSGQKQIDVDANGVIISIINCP